MCDAQYDSTSFAQDIRNSAYQLPALAQQYLRRARALRLELVNEAAQEQKARLRRGVQWLIASMAYVIRPRTCEQRSAGLTRVLMADKSLKAIMDTVEEGAFIPDDWVAMFALLTDELSCKDYGDLALDIFKPFVGWSLLLLVIPQRSNAFARMDSRPPAVIGAVTPTLTASAESIEPPPLFLPSPGIPGSTCVSPLRLKRARPVSLSTAEAQDLKRVKVGDESARMSPHDACEDVPTLTVVPATPTFISKQIISEKVSRASVTLGPAIALAPAVWRVSSSSPLASHVSCFPSPDNLVSCTYSVPAPSRTPTPPSEKKERKHALSRNKFTPTRSSGSGAVLVDKAAGVACGKGSLSTSVVTARPDVIRKTGSKFVPSKTVVSSARSVPLGEAVVSSKFDSHSKPAASSKSDSSGKPVASSESNSSTKSAKSSKFGSSSKATDRTNSSVSSVNVSTESALSRKSVNAEKFVPSRRESFTGLSKSVPRTPQPNCMNLQRRLIVVSPPPKQLKSMHRA